MAVSCDVVCGPCGPPIAVFRARRMAPLCYVMSLSFLMTDQLVPNVRSNDTRVVERE